MLVPYMLLVTIYHSGIYAAITLKSLPKKSLSSETTPDILSDYSSIMYNCGVVLGDIKL